MVEAPTPIVIISSTIDPNDVTTALQALRAGALTALPKPPAPGAPDFDDASRTLVETVKAMSQVKVVRRWPEPALRRPRPRPVAPTHPPAAPASLLLGAAPTYGSVVAIAASTGGPAALHRILSDLPGTFPAPILIVQHMSPGFIEGVAEWLDRASELRVKVAEHNESLAPGTAYLAPDGSHLGARRPGHIVLSSLGPMSGFRPSADFLFESVAGAFGASTLAVVLTGMGRDGAVGLYTVDEKGGRIVAQDEASSAVFGMPASAIASGLVDSIASLSDIASILVQMVYREKGVAT
jgi:two-component system chemotaxis response regulator CheB